MIRKCTNEENALLKTCENDILSYVGIKNSSKNEAFRFEIITSIILAIGISAMVCLSYIIDNTITNILGVLIMIIVGSVIIYFDFLGGHKRTKNKKHKLFQKSNFSINGGTFLEYCRDYDRGFITGWRYIEDDILDFNGKPIVLYSPLEKDLVMKKFDRMIILHTQKGDYIPMKLSETTASMISETVPDYVRDFITSNFTDSTD